jgi:hypothetical protein
VIIDDETTTVRMHHRRITFQDGPIIGAKKNRGRVSFQVTHLHLKWAEDTLPGAVVAHGVYMHPKVGVVHAERSYDLDGKKTPNWIKEAVNGAAQSVG